LGANYALKELDESGIQASHFARKSLHQKRFIFNHTFGRGAQKNYLSGQSKAGHRMETFGPSAFASYSYVSGQSKAGHRMETEWSGSTAARKNVWTE
jgi:hypothetical protein